MASGVRVTSSFLFSLCSFPLPYALCLVPCHIFPIISSADGSFVIYHFSPSSATFMPAPAPAAVYRVQRFAIWSA